jgi:gluconokinase
LTRLAGNAPAGSGGLIFHPYLNGERAPLWNSSARGSFFGLAMHHRKEHLIRAALEGVVYNLYSVLQTLERLTGTARRIHATGGFARSALWRQIVADVFNRDVHAPDSPEGSCLGAAVLGLYALGRIETLDAVAGMLRMTAQHQPIAANVATYAQLFPVFASLPGKLGQEYETIARLQQ